MALAKKVIDARMVEWRNLKKLHTAQGVRITRLEEENKQLKAQNAALKATIVLQATQIQTLTLQMEELRTMVFGKKRKKHDDDLPPPPTQKSIRTPESYHRPIPTEAEVTGEQSHSIDTCTSCKAPLTKKSESVYYEEDIPLPITKVVTKHTVEKGYCTQCTQWVSATPLPSAKVVLGARVQTYVSYLSVVARLSITQIQQLLFDTYQFSISEGEVVKILNRQAIEYRPEYEQLKEDIRSRPIVHLDETGWKLFFERLRAFAWSMSTPEGKAVFLVGESRGGGNVPKLLGANYKGVVITDDFGVYKKLRNHQLCWAHLIRKHRDLAQSTEMDAPTKAHHTKAYQALCTLYTEIRDNRTPSLFETYARKLTTLTHSSKLDCKKLRTYKETLLKNIPKYLTCLSDANIPMTNNQAERSLRHLVLKRKISFGSHSKQTAENLAILLSVFMSKRAENPRGWFREMLQGV
jgi:hypothetical protein